MISILDNIFYLGMSYGHYLILILYYLKIDTKEQFLYVGGVFPTYPPLVDGINHMPRINIPFLMLKW